MSIQNFLEIKRALCSLGIKRGVEITRFYYGVAEIEVNGEYFGIWDISRKTFVD